jgi:hypothetical protein
LNICEDNMTEYRRDESGKLYAWGGWYGNRTVDDARSDRDDFNKMMERRASELPRRRLSPLQRLALEEEIWGFDSLVKRRSQECGIRTSSSSRTPAPARAARFQAPTSAPAPSGRRRGRAGYVAVESFSYRDPSTGHTVEIKARRTHIWSSDHAALKVRPQAFALAA